MLDKQLVILIDQPLLDAIRLAALNDRRSMAAWVRVQLESAVAGKQLRQARNRKNKEVEKHGQQA